MPATDTFATWTGNQSLDAPAVHAAAITKHDTTEFTYATRAIYVGGAGDMVVVTVGGETVTFSSVPAGTVLPIRAVRVNSTNTTATNMVGLW